MSRAKSGKLPPAAPVSPECWLVLSGFRSCRLETAEDDTPRLSWSATEPATVFPSRAAAEAAIVACGVEGVRTVVLDDASPAVVGRAAHEKGTA